MRLTIDLGIDLGTTNSAAVVLNGTTQQVVKNSEQMDYTPSAVFVDKRARVTVGRKAKERIEVEPESVAVEFKRHMGEKKEIPLANRSQPFTPEELSTEVLKELRKDVSQALSEDFAAAVITVPAAFDLPQCAATKNAAKAAGFEHCALIQEPVAAAIAYGFQTDTERANWLVYDFGGGTFDVAVVRVQEGDISVVNHEGDNFLGGKNIDWDIVNQILIPEVIRQHKLPDFNDQNVEWKSAIAKLKSAAEAAKIRLSRETETLVELTFADREKKQEYEFSHTLRRADVERVIEPHLDRTITICKTAYQTKKLAGADIAKVLLVGGPTLTPALRERLKDSKLGLGIPLEFRVDPLTVVARGAAIFSGTQRRPNVAMAAVPAGVLQLQLEYSPMGPETEPLVGGRIVGSSAQDFSGYTIELVNQDAQPPWRSGKVGVSPNGTFMSTLWAEKGRTNLFHVEICDATGRVQKTEPDKIPYTVTAVFTAQPLVKSMGVAMANNKVDWLLRKGSALPTKTKTEVFYTTVELKPGDSASLLHIPIVEGENERADRNNMVGRLSIPGAAVRRAVPAGSDIELVLEIDESRGLKFRAYLPILDQDFEGSFNYLEEYRQKARDPQQLQDQLKLEATRLKENRAKADAVSDPVAKEAVQRVDRERILQEAEKAAAAAGANQDEANKFEQRLLELQVAIDQVEDAMAWPQLVVDTEAELDRAKRLIGDPEFKATSQEKAVFASLESEARRAIAARDPQSTRAALTQVEGLTRELLQRHPGWWVAIFQNLESRRSELTNQNQARIYLEQGQRAMTNNDVDSLRTAVRQLASLLPASDPQRQQVESGVIR